MPDWVVALVVVVAVIAVLALFAWWWMNRRRRTQATSAPLRSAASTIGAGPDKAAPVAPLPISSAGGAADSAAEKGRSDAIGVADIEGIGPAYAEKLAAAGVKTTDALLEAGASPKGRADLEAATGIDHALILKWVNRADLYRIKGIGSEYSDLLEVAGVDTVPELAQRNPGNLCQALAETNATRNLVRKVPTEAQVTDWVTQAKALPRVVTY